VRAGRETLADVPELIESHLINGQAVERLMLPDQPHLDGQRSFPKVEPK
jgi:(2Fe-2S) ferredoxin